MAFLRETAGSLRVYLIIAGALGTVSQMTVVVSAEAGPLGRLLALVGVAISLAYVWVGFALKSLVARTPRRAEQVLMAGAIYLILVAVVAVVAYPGPVEAGGAVGRAAIGLLITLYLLANVRRMVREQAGQSSPKMDVSNRGHS